MSTQAELCEAIKDWINEPATQAQLTYPSFTAIRVNLPIGELENSDDLAVTVFPGPRQLDRIGRRLWQRSVQVFIAVQKKIVVATESERQTKEDELMQLSEELEELIAGEGFLEYARGDDADAVLPPFLPPDMETKNQFTSVIPLTYLRQ